jgi:S1-C subfamily serine protease/HEAT repeat protein
MLQIKCPHCQNAMALNAMPASGRVSCTKCGQQLVLQAPAPRPPAAPRAQVMPGQGSSIRQAVPQPVQMARAVPVDEEHRAPIKKKKKKKKEGVSTTTWLIIGGAGACLIVILGVVFIYVSMSGSGGGKIDFDPVAAARNAQQAPADVSNPGKPAAPNKKGAPRNDPPEDDGGNNAGGREQADPNVSTEQPKSFNEGGGGGGGGAPTSTDVYNYVLKSAAFFLVGDASGPKSSGSGALIDKKNRLVLTNHHVAGDASRVLVFFPLYDKNGKLIVERERFLDQIRSRRGSLLEGKVIASDPIRDICIVQIPRVPPGVEAVPLAKQSVRVGERVHSVGNPGASGGLWVYAPGVVRSLYHKRWIGVDSDGGNETQHEADIIETQSPVNPGDSGGPLVNDRGELVGVTQGGSKETLSTISMFIDVAEVKKFVESQVPTHLRVAWAPEARAPLTSGSGGGNPATVAANVSGLVETLKSTDAAKRAKAAETLGEMGEKARAAIPSLVKLLTDSDEFVRRMANNALAKIGKPGRNDLPMVQQMLRDTEVEKKRWAAETLEKMGNDARPAMTDMISIMNLEKDGLVRQPLARAAGKFGRDAKDLAKGPLEEMLKDEDRDNRLAACEGLASLYGATSDLESLKKLLKHEDADFRSVAAKGIMKMGRNAKPVLNDLYEVAKSDSGEIRKAFLLLVASLDPADAKVAGPLVTESLQSGDKEVKMAALTVLGNAPKDVPNSTVNILKELIKDAEVKAKVLECLAKVGPFNKNALTVLVDLIKENGDDAEAATKALVELGAAAAPAVPALIRLMDVPGNQVSQEEQDRIHKLAGYIAKIGKPALKDLRSGVRSRNFYRWGCAIAIGEMGRDAREALPDLQAALQSTQEQFVRESIEESIRKVQGR